MQVKIIKASEPTYWYAKCIGKIFTVDTYSVKDKEFILNRLPDNAYLYNEPIAHYINHDDCILVSGDIKYNTHGDSKLKFYFV